MKSGKFLRIDERTLNTISEFKSPIIPSSSGFQRVMDIGTVFHDPLTETGISMIERPLSSTTVGRQLVFIVRI